MLFDKQQQMRISGEEKPIDRPLGGSDASVLASGYSFRVSPNGCQLF
ncbi:MAG: hypothetical protein WBB29_21510 [Geitlerinemataceae cyanobacterium]